MKNVISILENGDTAQIILHDIVDDNSISFFQNRGETNSKVVINARWGFFKNRFQVSGLLISRPVVLPNQNVYDTPQLRDLFFVDDGDFTDEYKPWCVIFPSKTGKRILKPGSYYSRTQRSEFFFETTCHVMFSRSHAWDGNNKKRYAIGREPEPGKTPENPEKPPETAQNKETSDAPTNTTVPPS